VGQALLLLALILINGALSMSEMAIASSRRARLTARALDGDAGAQAALELAAAPNRFLSTVQVGITLIGIIVGAIGEASFTAPVEAALAGLPAVAPASRWLSLVIVVAVITYLSLVIGELVPKRLALQHAEAIAARVARPMQTLSRLAAPAVAFLSASTNAVLRLLRVGPPSEPAVTEEEVELLLQEATSAGVFAPAEQELVAGVFDLGDRRVGELMTPRYRIVALDLQDPPEVNRKIMAESPHRAFPVYDGDLDHLVGIVTAKDLWTRVVRGEPEGVRDVVRRPTIVPESLPALAALDRFRTTGEEIAIVVDEYGGVQGLLTLHDVLEAIVGDLEPAGAAAEQEAVRRPDGSWLLDGALPAHDVRELLDLPTLPGEAAGEFETLGGFIMAQLGHIPQAAETVDWGGWRFEVVDMDGRRVDRVLATQAVGEPADEG
jgi:magnesium and cobalt exporter, CNNM family